MAEKEVVNVIKLQIEAGKATPAPPVGLSLIHIYRNQNKRV